MYVKEGGIKMLRIIPEKDVKAFGIELKENEKAVLGIIIPLRYSIDELKKKKPKIGDKLIENGRPVNDVQFKIYIIDKNALTVENPKRILDFEWNKIPDNYKKEILEFLEREERYRKEMNEWKRGM